jgi:hypothetical protein
MSERAARAAAAAYKVVRDMCDGVNSSTNTTSFVLRTHPLETESL